MCRNFVSIKKKNIYNFGYDIIMCQHFFGNMISLIGLICQLTKCRNLDYFQRKLWLFLGLDCTCCVFCNVFLYCIIMYCVFLPTFFFFFACGAVFFCLLCVFCTVLWCTVLCCVQKSLLCAPMVVMTYAWLCSAVLCVTTGQPDNSPLGCDAYRIQCELSVLN